MSSKVWTENQHRWFRAVHLTISHIIEGKLTDVKTSTPTHDHLSWRLAVNLFYACEYERSFPLLELVAEKDEIFFSDDTNITSWVHQVTGRCAAQLFYKTQEYKYLERAYLHYQNAVQTMVVNLFTMFKLPLLLLEFGHILEDYGAFGAANDLYTRILSGFPNFRGYFDAIYRSAIVGRHLASLMTESAAKEEAINKCLDIIQFLLEALPSNISDYQIVLLYGRTLEMSSNPQVKFRAHSIYRSLFELCQTHFIAGANKVKDASEWLEDPASWFNLGKEIAATGEPLIAKDAFRKFMELKQKQASSSFSYENQDIAAHLDPDTCLTLALSAARYQNYEEATEYAELGLRIDRYHKQLRHYISIWSKLHAAELNTEVGAVRSILSVWKGRCWTNGFRRKLKNKMIEDNEERYRIDRFDLEARENLAYYAKDKYRSKFMFEEFCAVRLQRFVRERKKQGVWMEAQRQHQYTLASEAHRRYVRVPYNKATRADVLRISSHRLVPAKHPILSDRETILEQNQAVVLIERCMHTHRIRRALLHKIRETKQRRARKIFLAARVIQCAARRMIAIAAMEARFHLLERYAVAARVIQRWIRRLYGSFYIAVLRIKEMTVRRRRRAYELLRARLPNLVKSFLGMRRLREVVQHNRMIEAEERRLALEHQKKIDRATKLIQNFHKSKQQKFLSKLSKDALQKRKEVNFSISSTELVTHMHFDKSSLYQIPGINQQSASFIRATQQKAVYCSGFNQFSAADCLMLSMVLRSPACAVKTLVLHAIEDVKNPCYEFDLLAALRKCVSVRAVYVLGGAWAESFLQALVQVVHVENPRIQTLVIEQVRHVGTYIQPLATSVGRMLLDYFNYSIPGVTEICLHGCSLGDSQLDLISSGIAVNSSIKTLTLSLNLIEDAGFVRVFKAFIGNKRSKIEKLDFSYNLIAGNSAVKSLFREYQAHDLKYFLVVNLMHNRIYDYYHPVNDIKQRGLRCSTLTIIYTPEDLELLMRPNRRTPGIRAALGGSMNTATAAEPRKPPPPSHTSTNKLRMLHKLHSASTTSLDSLGSDSVGSNPSLSHGSIVSKTSTARSLLPLPHTLSASALAHHTHKKHSPSSHL